MSSTSSSECLCSECFNYTAAYRSPSFRTRAPYYQTLGGPLIYYAQVQPSNLRPRREARKGNPNCFVKAFRWYTQDHYPQANRHSPSDRTDLNGFAMWLDKKYDEFILEKHAEQELFQGQPKQPTEPSLLGTEILCSCTELDPSDKKWLGARLRSPFMKRRPRTEYSKESGDTPDKCNQSLEYILKPKELSRPTSDCSHLIASSENSKKTVKMKAHSSDTTTVHEKSDIVPLSRSGVNDTEGTNGKTDYIAGSNVERGDIAGSNVKREGSISKIPEIKAIEYQKITLENVESGIKSLKDVSCQGPEEKLVCTDAPVQCDTSCKNKTWTENPVPRYSCCPACSLKNQSEYSAGPSQARVPVPIVVQCPCPTSVRRASAMRAPTAVRHQSIALDPKPLIIQDVETVISSPLNSPNIRFDSIEAQTSDYPICLETEHSYPLFMKIICADKLNEDCKCRK